MGKNKYLSGYKAPAVKNQSSLDQRALSRYDIPFQAFETEKTWERCTVNAVDPVTYTCDVYTETGREFYGLPWPSTHLDSSGPAGDITAPRLLQKMIIHYNLGVPRLIASDPVLQKTPEAETSISGISSGSGSKNISRNRPNYRGGRPKDILPGDWIRLGSRGNYVAVLEGGLSILRGGELSQVIANPHDDSVRILARNLDLYTDFGEIEFTNNGGQVNMSLSGGSQQEDETSPSVGGFTISADLGAKGDAFEFYIGDPRGTVYWRSHIRPDGSQELFTGDIDSYSTGNCDYIVAGNKKDVVMKDYAGEIRGSSLRGVQGDCRETVYGQKTVAAAGVTFTAGENLVGTAAQEVRFLSGGLTNVPGESRNPSTLFTVYNGDMEIRVSSSPDYGGADPFSAGFSVYTDAGDILLSPSSGYTILQGGVKPDSIILGGKQGSDHAMIYEAFEAFAKLLTDIVLQHTHGSAVGPTTPTVPPPSLLPRVPELYAKYLNTQVSPIRSRKVIIAK